jgi:hypothetical protein
VQEGGRRLVDEVREYLHEFVADGDTGELHGATVSDDYESFASGRTNRATATPAVVSRPRASAARFVWTHVRQALQQTVAVGAASPYFAAA